MKSIVALILLLVLTTSLCDAADAPKYRQSYTDRNGSTVARSYTNSPYTVYRSPNGSTLGYSKQTINGSIRIVDKNGVYGGMIVNGFLKDSRGNTVGRVNTRK